MTNVEELREALFCAINPHTFLNDGVLDHYEEHPAITVLMDSLIAVAREEGAEKGVAQERERIREEADEWMTIPAYSHCNVRNDYPDKLRLVPSSVLAPKEGK